MKQITFIFGNAVSQLHSSRERERERKACTTLFRGGGEEKVCRNYAFSMNCLHIVSVGHWETYLAGPRKIFWRNPSQIKEKIKLVTKYKIWYCSTTIVSKTDVERNYKFGGHFSLVPSAAVWPTEINASPLLSVAISLLILPRLMNKWPPVDKNRIVFLCSFSFRAGTGERES